jgi:PAS domain S-box-containing protein
VTQDENERRDAIEAALRESEQRWRTAVSGAPIVLFALDKDGIFTLSEGRGLVALGLQPGQVVGQSVFEVYAGHEGICAAARRALAGEALHQQVDVADLAFELRYSPILDPDGAPAGTIGVATDITEQRRLERRFEESRRLESIGILAGGIAHAFNNLLTAIVGNTALAATRLPDDHEVHELLDRAEAAANRAADLTSRILAFSGRGGFAVETLDPGAMLDELRLELEAAAPPTVHLHFDREADVPAIEADQGRFREVVRHLVRNAFESCTAGSGVVKIRLGVREVPAEQLEEALRSESCVPGAYLALEVSDNGSGMEMETRSRVFDPFFTTKGQGRGLGLAAVLGIMRGHGGAVRIETTPGVGTVIEALFPLGLRTSGDQEERVASSPSGGASQRILVVDDEPSLRDVITMSLEFADYEVYEAESGEQALEIFDEHADEIRLVLLDLTMPGMSGEETFRALRQRSTVLPIVVMSGFATDEAMTELEAASGPHDFLQKPFGPADLVEKLSVVLS